MGFYMKCFAYAHMDIIKSNIPNVREFIQRRDYSDTTVIDFFSVMYILVGQKSTIEFDERDKHVQFLLSRVRGIVPGVQRQFFMESMFRLFEKMSQTSPSDPTWLLLQADIVYSSA